MDEVELIMRELGKKRFEVALKIHPNGSIEKGIFVDGEHLDYSVDITSYREACKMGTHMKRAVQEDIVKHFTGSVSEVVGRKVTVEELIEAHKTGWI